MFSEILTSEKDFDMKQFTGFEKIKIKNKEIKAFVWVHQWETNWWEDNGSTEPKAA